MPRGRPVSTQKKTAVITRARVVIASDQAPTSPITAMETRTNRVVLLSLTCQPVSHARIIITSWGMDWSTRSIFTST